MATRTIARSGSSSGGNLPWGKLLLTGATLAGAYGLARYLRLRTPDTVVHPVVPPVVVTPPAATTTTVDGAPLSRYWKGGAPIALVSPETFMWIMPNDPNVAAALNSSPAGTDPRVEPPGAVLIMRSLRVKYFAVMQRGTPNNPTYKGFAFFAVGNTLDDFKKQIAFNGVGDTIMYGPYPVHGDTAISNRELDMAQGAMGNP